MFGRLKEKLKKWTKKVSGTDEILEEKIEVSKKLEKKKNSAKKTVEESKKTKLPSDKKLKEEVSKKEYLEPEKKFNLGTLSHEPDLEKISKEISDEKEEKKGFFKKLFYEKKKITDEQFEEYSEDLEMILLENNVALEVAEGIIKEIKKQIVEKELSRKEIESTIINSLEEKINEILVEPFDIIEEIKNHLKNNLGEPYIILFCGINGAGKTTTIAKFANLLKKERISSVMGAGDTFRAASIEQLKQHGEKLNLPVIAQQYGSDPAAVAFDAIKYAKKNKISVVLIDTAGRMHTAINLIREMEKIKRISKPNRTIFLGEAITGNDSVDQVRAFDEAIGIDGIILSKADIDEKGGTALSVGYITKKPIIYLGTGQEYKNLEKFNKKEFIKKLDLK